MISMMPPQKPNHEGALAYSIELGLQRIATAPDDVALHQQLRVTGLRYKAEGGPAAGLLERLNLTSREPLQRLLHAERIWSMDPGNLSLIPEVLAALSGLERTKPDRDFSAVRRWVSSILSAGTGEA